MSWESTLSYYKIINEGIRQALGGLHSAKLCLFSVDFEEIETLQHNEKWDEAALILSEAAKAIESGGADFLLICTNTMHKVAPEIEKAVSIPVLHISDTTAEKLRRNNINTVGLLGTKFTMSQGFYKGRIKEKFGIDVVVPDEEDQNTLHKIIYDELCMSIINSESKSRIIKILEKLNRQGAEAVILGCTEIGLLVQQNETDIPLYDTTAIHAAKAVEMAIS